ncbi:MAG: hypothetical protein LKJ52_10000, partial [Lactobacillus sp.]|nr:hypothetical protein [Lactobacillus sp.]
LAKNNFTTEPLPAPAARPYSNAFTVSLTIAQDAIAMPSSELNSAETWMPKSALLAPDKLLDVMID